MCPKLCNIWLNVEAGKLSRNSLNRVTKIFFLNYAPPIFECSCSCALAVQTVFQPLKIESGEVLRVLRSWKFVWCHPGASSIIFYSRDLWTDLWLWKCIWIFLISMYSSRCENYNFRISLFECDVCFIDEQFSDESVICWVCNIYREPEVMLYPLHIFTLSPRRSLSTKKKM